MGFSWTTLLAVFAFNTLYMGFMFLLQALDKNLPPRHSIIPGTRQRFLYVQDFHSCTWGDFLAIPLIANAFVFLAMSSFIGRWSWAIFTAIAVLDGTGFLMMCLGKNHKPDQGYPKIGWVSLHGLSHLPYHGIGVAIALFDIWHTIKGNLRGPVLYLLLLGAVIYIASFVADIKSGNFDPLKRE